MTTLEDFLTSGVFTFMLIFVRIGTAIMIMPGVGDSFTPQNVRLYIALGLTLVLTPVMMPYMPSPVPGTAALFLLIVMEFIIGLFIGTIARILTAALDVAGMIISMQSGLGNAQLFNPASATQGSLIGAFLSVTGVVLLFTVKLHHLLFMGLAESYELFPVGGVPDTGSMANLVSMAVSSAFLIGFQIAVPFMIVAMMMYIGMGVLSRLMPQVQVFMLALPLQILISFTTMSFVISAGLLFWLSRFEHGMVFFLSNGGG